MKKMTVKQTLDNEGRVVFAVEFDSNGIASTYSTAAELLDGILAETRYFVESVFEEEELTA